jgi:Fic family protein
MSYKPPITISEKIVNLVAEISELVGKIHVGENVPTSPRLRKNNRIRSIHSSLAIENNSLSLEQVTAIINGRRVLGSVAEIREVKNAFEAYDIMLSLDPFDMKDMLSAHAKLMQGLVAEAGQFRTAVVGVFAGDRLIHLAPPAQFVPQQIEDLLAWTANSDLNMLIKSCVFHYEFEYIHPFQDGNGRMGRMWQTLLLSKYKPMFMYLPVETLIKNRQQEYYSSLAEADSVADSCIFVEFLLQAIFDTLKEYDAAEELPINVKIVIEALAGDTLSAKELMERVGLSHLQTFRNNYLKPALAANIIEMTEPNSPNSRNQKYFRKF